MKPREMDIYMWILADFGSRALLTFRRHRSQKENRLTGARKKNTNIYEGRDIALMGLIFGR